jgi:hypothetical protein
VRRLLDRLPVARGHRHAVLSDNREAANGSEGPFPLFLLDGKNRREALRRLGVTDPQNATFGQIVCTTMRIVNAIKEQGSLGSQGIKTRWVTDVDPLALHLSLNVFRRHLTPEQRREMIGRVLEKYPHLSNRAIADAAGLSEPTVRRARKSGASHDAPEKRTGKDGKEYPAKSKKPKIIGVGVNDPQASADERRAQYAADEPVDTGISAEPTIEDAEAELKRLKALKATLKNNGKTEDKVDAQTSMKALAAFKAASGQLLPGMNSDHLQEAIDYFAEAVEVPANELMPDLSVVQFDLKIAKAEVTALKRKLAGKLPPRESRAAAWARLASEARDNVETLMEFQQEFEQIKDEQPENLQDSPFAQKCEEICGIDLESAHSALQEAEDAEVPLGFGRD